MSDAINILYQCLGLIVSWFFSAEIVPGVTLGWVSVCLIVFGYLVSNILNVPRSASAFSFNSHDYVRSAKQGINRTAAANRLDPTGSKRGYVFNRLNPKERN